MIDLVCSALVVGRLGGGWAVYWCGWRSKRRGVGLPENEVSKHVRLLLAAREGCKMRSG